MQTLDVLILAADDVQTEARACLRRINDLDRSAPRLTIRASRLGAGAPGADEPAAADLALVVVWSELDAELEAGLGAVEGAEQRWLFTKTAPVEVDLADRDAVLARLERKTALEVRLEAQRPGWDRVIAFETPERFALALERELRGWLAARLEPAAGELRFRPLPNATHLPRSRLLERLPDAPGHAVWLEAPYGYGKSVLAGQWADRLEADGWRVMWLARASQPDLGPLLRAALGVAGDTPDPIVRDRLWEEATLLVIEDLEGGEELDWLLEDLRGLLLLASRGALTSERLAERLERGRATRFGADELGFTRAEADALLERVGAGGTETDASPAGATSDAARLHATTLGWALPLHVAALTGAAPDAASLVAGIRASLAPEAWRELLFLAAAPHLPVAAATEATRTLVDKGFVQTLEGSYRLHPYLSERLRESHAERVADAVRVEAQRLPLLLRGEAFERTGDLARLETVLEANEAEPWRRAPGRLVAWDEAVGGAPSARRHWTVGAALARLNEIAAAVDRLERALEVAGDDADLVLGILRSLCTPLGIHAPQRAPEVMTRAEPLLAEADPVLAGRFLTDAAVMFALAGRFDEAIATGQRALELLPSSSPYRLGPQINDALFRYNHRGDFDRRLAVQTETLERTQAMYPVQAAGQARDVAMMHWWLGDVETARHFFERAAEAERINPAIGVEVHAALAYLAGDDATLDARLRDARLFANPYVADIVGLYALTAAHEAGDAERVDALYRASDRGPFVTSGYARALAERGERDAALRLLDAHRDAEDRAERLYLEAARHLAGDEAALERFLELTSAGARLLPGFVPVEALPDRPELAAHYPIEEVLASGWNEAIASRMDDVPELEVDLLGAVEIRLLGRPVELPDRQTQLLTLLALGLNREAAAEAMWPEADVKKQRNNLNVQLNGLRKAIEPWGVATYLHESGLRRVASDYRRLLAALDAGDAATVLELYREPFAPGIDLAPAEEERGRLREAAVDLLADAGARGEVEYVARVLELEPLHETALQELLRALLRRGRRREAWRRFEAFEAVLRREMELEPLDETRAILEG